MTLLSLLACVSGGPTFEGRLIKKVSYSYGGGMTGGYDSIELARQDDGSVVLSTRTKEWHNSRESGYDYVANEGDFDRFAEIANEYNLYKASKRKYSEQRVLDGATSHVSYSVMEEDGSYDLEASINISSEQTMNSKEREGFSAVKDALYALTTGESTAYLEALSATLMVRGVQYQLWLNDSTAAEELAKLDYLSVELKDVDGCAKAFHLDTALEVGDTPLADATEGSICYDAASDDIIIFYADGKPSDELYLLGEFKSKSSSTYFADVENGEASFTTNYFTE